MPFINMLTFTHLMMIRYVDAVLDREITFIDGT